MGTKWRPKSHSIRFQSLRNEELRPSTGQHLREEVRARRRQSNVELQPGISLPHPFASWSVSAFGKQNCADRPSQNVQVQPQGPVPNIVGIEKFLLCQIA